MTCMAPLTLNTLAFSLHFSGSRCFGRGGRLESDTDAGRGRHTSVAWLLRPGIASAMEIIRLIVLRCLWVSPRYWPLPLVVEEGLELKGQQQGHWSGAVAWWGSVAVSWRSVEWWSRVNWRRRAGASRGKGLGDGYLDRASLVHAGQDRAWQRKDAWIVGLEGGENRLTSTIWLMYMDG
jgi:hypothetical protein